MFMKILFVGNFVLKYQKDYMEPKDPCSFEGDINLRT